MVKVNTDKGTFEVEYIFKTIIPTTVSTIAYYAVNPEGELLLIPSESYEELKGLGVKEKGKRW